MKRSRAKISRIIENARPKGLTISMVLVLHKYSKDCVVPPDPWRLLELARPSKRGPERASRPYERVKRLTPEQVDQLVARYNEIRSMRQVAREAGLDRTTVREHLRRAGVHVRISKPMTERQKERAHEMYVAGMPSTLIGKKLGFSHHTILRAVRGS